jgi:hypothetical protein
LGGAGIARNLNVGGTLTVSGTSTQAAINASGMVTASSGLTVNTSLLYTGTDILFWNVARGGGTAQTGQLGIAMVHDTGNVLTINYGGTNSFSGGVLVNGGITSSNTSTGSLRVVGGMAVSGNINVGGTLVASGISRLSDTTITGSLNITQNLTVGAFGDFTTKTISFGGSNGDLDTWMTTIESRNYSGNTTTIDQNELLLYKGNDGNTSGSIYIDRIRLRSGEIRFDTFTASDGLATKYGDNNRMIIKTDGNVGIGTTAPVTTFQVVGETTLAVTTMTGGLVVTGGSLNVGGPSTLTGPTTLSNTTVNGTFNVNSGTLRVSGLWVAVGNSTAGNTIATSYDGGTTWTGSSSIFSVQGYGVAWNGSLWVAVGEGASHTIATSTDGTTWTGRGVSTFTTRGRGVVWSPSLSLWVAVGQGGNAIVTSTDGITWTSRVNTTTIPFPFNDRGLGVAWNGSLFVAVGLGGNSIATSTDGITWTGRSNGMLAPFSGYGGSVAWNGSLWVAVGSGGNAIATSTDGTTWTGRGILAPFNTFGSGVVWSSTLSLWVAVGQGGNSIATSRDGINWLGRGTSTFTTYGQGVSWNGSLFVATGLGGNSIATSSDGITWAGRASPFTSNGSGAFGTPIDADIEGTLTVTQDASLRSALTVSGPTKLSNTSIHQGSLTVSGLWVVVGEGATHTIATSSDGGTTWIGRGNATFTNYGIGIGWNGSLWVAGGGLGAGGNTLATSTDGINWTGLGTTIFSSVSRGIAWNGSYWLALGGGGNTIARSTNGTTWTGYSGTFTTGWAAAWNGSLWVAVGQGTNTIATSSDGIAWTGQGAVTFTSAGYGVTWNGSLFVATGQGGNSFATSSNGTTWTGFGTTIFSTNGRGVAWSPSLSTWVAVGAGTGNTIAISTNNGTTWSGNGGTTLFTSGATGVSWNGSMFVAVGAGGTTIATSTNGSIWTARSGTTVFSNGGNGVAGTPNDTTLSGPLTVTQDVNLRGTLNIANGDLTTPGTNVLSLWGTSRDYGFGIASNTLKYLTGGNHSFFTAGTPTSDGTLRARIDTNGLSLIGSINVTSTGTSRITGSNTAGSAAIELFATNGCINLDVRDPNNFNAMTARNGAVNYMNVETGNGSNYMDARGTGSNNFVRGPCTFSNYSSTPSAVTINNTNGLNVGGTPAVNGGGINVTSNTAIFGPNSLSMWGGGGGFGLGLASDTVKYCTSVNHRFYTGTPSTNANDGTLRAYIDNNGLTVANRIVTGGGILIDQYEGNGSPIPAISNIMNVVAPYEIAAKSGGGGDGLLRLRAGFNQGDGVTANTSYIDLCGYKAGGGDAGDRQIRFGTNSIERMRIDVNGDVIMQKNLYIGNNATSNTDTKSIFFGGLIGDNGYDHTVIESRLYNYPTAGESTELLLFKGNDVVGSSGPDRIRLYAGEIRFDVFTNAITTRTTENNIMRITTAGAIVTGTVTAVSYFATSDKRIKANINDLNLPSLDIIRKIKPREYTLIDGKSNESVYGFVAQEIKELIPKSVQTVTDFIPSVYENAFVDGNKITLLNKSTSDISFCKLKTRGKNGGDIIVDVTSIDDSKTFTIDGDISNNIFCVDICGNTLDEYTKNGVTTYKRGSTVYTGEVKKGIFVYGIQVDDFHTVDKDTIWTVTLSATQELDKQLQHANTRIAEQDIRIAEQDIRIAELEQTIQRQQADIDEIKRRLG